MKKYITASIEVIEFENSDILTESSESGGGSLIPRFVKGLGVSPSNSGTTNWDNSWDYNN